MHHTQAEVKDELQKEVFLLRMLREEATRSLHLGGPDAQNEWRRLEPVVSAALALAEREASDDACWKIAQAATQMRALCAKLY